MLVMLLFHFDESQSVSQSYALCQGTFSCYTGINMIITWTKCTIFFQSCIEMFGGDSQLGGIDRILLSAFEFDVCAVIKESRYKHWYILRCSLH